MSSTTNFNMPGSAGQHWVRYGTAADQRYLLRDFNETYDQLVVNGNMVAHMPSAISQFITQRAQKPFVIDPQTHAFAHDLGHLRSTSKSSAGEIKRSWRKLIDIYGGIVTEALVHDGRPLEPEDFDKVQIREELAESVLRFQKDSIEREITEGEDRAYLEVLQEEHGVNPFLKPPELLIAPYFFIDGPLAEGWFETNLKLIAAARKVMKKQKLELPLAAQVVISKGVLSDEDWRNRVIRRYSLEKPDLILIWIDQFSEHNTTETELNHFIELIQGFANKEIAVVNLFGGFFSVALMRFSTILQGKVAAVCHGLEYGETRPVIPLGGGIPVARFYSRQLHHRLPPRVAFRMIHHLGGFESLDNFQRKICDCRNCLEVIHGDPREAIDAYFEVKESAFWRAGKRVAMEFPTGRASDNCTRHYMWCKEWEYRRMDASVDELTDKLAQADRSLRKHLGVDFAGHPHVWSKVLK